MIWLSALLAAIILLINLDRIMSRSRPAIASLSSAQGSIEFRHEDDVIWSRLMVGENIGDRFLVAAGDKSFATITFVDGRVIKLSENSQILLSKEVENQSEIHRISLVRGEVVALKPSRVGAKFSLSSQSVPLVIKAKADKTISLEDISSSLRVRRNVDMDRVEINRLDGINPDSGNIPDNQKMEPPHVAPTVVPTETVGKVNDINPFEINSGLFLGKDDLGSGDSGVPVAKPSVVIPKLPVVKNQPKTIILPMPISKPVTVSVSPTPSPAIQIAAAPKIVEVHPPPVVEGKDDAIFCTFKEFREGLSLDRLNLLLKWTPNELAQPLDKPFFALEVSSGERGDDYSQGLTVAPLTPGLNSVAINIEDLLQGKAEGAGGVTVVPIRIRSWVRQSEDDSVKVSRIHESRIRLCSLARLKEQSYQVFLNEISESRAKRGDWFEWQRNGESFKYVLTFHSKELFNRFQNVLKSARDFKIVPGEFRSKDKSIYFVKYGRVLASLHGPTPLRSELKLVRYLINADYVFATEGGAYLPLENSISSKMIAVDRILRGQEKIYIFSHGRLVTIEKNLVRDNAALVRSYMQGTWGVFLTPPVML